MFWNVQYDVSFAKCASYSLNRKKNGGKRRNSPKHIGKKEYE